MLAGYHQQNISHCVNNLKQKSVRGESHLPIIGHISA